MTSKRDITTLNQNAILAQDVRPIMFARMAFSSGVRRLHTEIGSRTATHPIFGAESYIGIGDFGGMTSDIKESISVAPDSISIAISGVSSVFVDIALDDDYYRRDIELMFGFDDEDGVLLDDPVIVYSGFMDKAGISVGAGKAEITLTCESRATNLQTASDLRFSDEDLQAAVTGDKAGEYIYRMSDLVINWGGDSITQLTSTSGWSTGSGSYGGSSKFR
jgi:hypothetical protein